MRKILDGATYNVQYHVVSCSNNMSSILRNSKGLSLPVLARRTDGSIRNLNSHRGILPLASTRVIVRVVAMMATVATVATVVGRCRRQRFRWRRFDVAKAQTVRVHREFCAIYPNSDGDGDGALLM
ncbi:uncharacterized protein LOC118645972 [Monomorium pharaonis]|uniref:uncharacterized protein LOC118645972 n=1 Tax=Monomorium pharaonis TaxID=307658 RepID=UPI001747D66A|nr:uncharacterized protein LOC118645972 [Monomorium pharaonis]